MSTSHRAKRKTRAVGILVEDDSCPGLETLIGAAAATGWHFGWDVYGIDGGFDGLRRRKPRRLDPGDIESGAVSLASPPRGGGLDDIDDAADLRRTVHGHGLAGLIAVGGIETQERAERFHRRDVAVVGVPKAVENDVAGTAAAFGFDTAVATAVSALGKLQMSARTTGRVLVVEVRGRRAGWVALHTGLASGAAAILVPEIPFDVESVCESVRARGRAGGRPATIVVAQGATPTDAAHEARPGGITEWLAPVLAKRLKRETCGLDVSLMQLGGPPSASDLLLGARLGSAAMRLVNEGLFGNMVALKPPAIASVPLHQVTGRTRPVALDSDVLRTARDLGIGLGD